MDTSRSPFPDQLAGQVLPPFASYPIGMWAPKGTSAPLGSSAAAGAFPALLSPDEARAREAGRGGGRRRGASGRPREEKNMASAAEGGGAPGRAGRH